MSDVPVANFQVSDQDAWEKWWTNNQDFYGSGVIRYAERWAAMMEQAIADQGLPPEDVIPKVANRMSHEADTEGITGFMYGAAVSVLATCWAHGEILRRWHNLDVQIGTEGERANASGSVLNPAILSIQA